MPSSRSKRSSGKSIEDALTHVGPGDEVRILDLPGLPPKGDVSDWLDAGGTVEGLKEHARTAPGWEPAVPSTALKVEGAHTARPLLRTLAEILSDPDVMKEPEPVIPRLAFGARLTMLSAREKEGKSTLASAGAAAVSGGARFLGEFCKRGSVLWVGLEEHLGDTARTLPTI